MPYNDGAGHLSVFYFEDITIAPLGTYEFIIDLKTFNRLNLFLKSNYQATDAGASGVTVTQMYGMEKQNGGQLFAGNSDVVTTLVTTPLGAGPTEVVSTWNVSVKVLSRYLKLLFTNTDPVNSAVIALFGDN